MIPDRTGLLQQQAFLGNFPAGTALPATGAGQNGQTITFLGNFPAGTALPASGQNGQSINIGGRIYVYHVNGQNINPQGGDVIIYQGQTGWVYNAL